MAKQVDVSIVMSVYNASKWLDEVLGSVASQTFAGSLELSVFDDASTRKGVVELQTSLLPACRGHETDHGSQLIDTSLEILKRWQLRFEQQNIQMVVSGHSGCKPRGPGYGRNRAIAQSNGQFLCFLDADDFMAPERIDTQHAVALDNPNTLIGTCFTRHPQGSTERYTRWCNTLTPSQLYTQAFTAFGPTIILPTWFCARGVFDKAGPFSEDGRGTPEDLMFFYKHLSTGGKLLRADKPLVVYRYHQDSESFNIDRRTIWKLRVEAVQDFVLVKWKQFTIWNAGKQGRQLYRSLRPEHRAKVIGFCDVDCKKIEHCYIYEESEEVPKPRIPIVHFTKAKPPFLLCIKWELTDGGFESNLASLNLKEGEDYYHFS